MKFENFEKYWNTSTSVIKIINYVKLISLTRLTSDAMNL